MRYGIPAIAIPIPPKWSVATKRRYNSSLFFFIFIMILYVSVWRQSRCLLSQKANTSSLPDKSPVWPPYRANLIKGYQQRFWCQKAGLRGRIGDCQYNGVRREGYGGESILYRRKKTPHCGVSSKLVGERGFEPPTHWSQTSCATKLRYSPMSCILLLLDANCII